jgi:hypothetical protein
MLQPLKALAGDRWNPYRPEDHYMRGPGPKSHRANARNALRVMVGRSDSIMPTKKTSKSTANVLRDAPKKAPGRGEADPRKNPNKSEALVVVRSLLAASL